MEARPANDYREVNPRATVERSITIQGTTLQVVHGDLTEERTDAITNAANEALWLGGGVAGAIERRGGYRIEQECTEFVRKHGHVPVGDVAVTTGGNLPSKYVIHAVGPIYASRQDNEELLQKTVINTFRKAEDLGLSSVSIPGISSGIFGFPKDKCAIVMFKSFVQYMKAKKDAGLKLIRFINFDTPTVSCFEREFDRMRENFEELSQVLVSGIIEEASEPKPEDKAESERTAELTSSQETSSPSASPWRSQNEPEESKQMDVSGTQQKPTIQPIDQNPASPAHEQTTESDRSVSFPSIQDPGNEPVSAASQSMNPQESSSPSPTS